MKKLILFVCMLGAVFGVFYPTSTQASNDYCNLQTEELDPFVSLILTDATQEGLDRMELSKEDLPDLVKTVFFRMHGFELNRQITLVLVYPQDFRYLVAGVQDNYGGVGGQHFVYDQYYCRYSYRSGATNGQSMAFATVGFNWALQREDSLIFGNFIHEIAHAVGAPDNHTGWLLWNADTWHSSDVEYHMEVAESAFYYRCDIYAHELYLADGGTSRRFYRDVLPTFDDPRYLACVDLQEIRMREE